MMHIFCWQLQIISFFWSVYSTKSWKLFWYDDFWFYKNTEILLYKQKGKKIIFHTTISKKQCEMKIKYYFLGLFWPFRLLCSAPGTTVAAVQGGKWRRRRTTRGPSTAPGRTRGGKRRWPWRAAPPRVLAPTPSAAASTRNLSICLCRRSAARPRKCKRSIQQNKKVQFKTLLLALLIFFQRTWMYLILSSMHVLKV